MSNEIPNGGANEVVLPQPAFDLGTLDTIGACNKGAEIELMHPANRNKGVGIFISLLGKDSDVFNEIVENHADAEDAREFKFRRKNKVPEPKPFRQRKTEGVDTSVFCTVGWRTAAKAATATSPATEGGNYIVLHGEKLLFSHANARKLYIALPWVKEQVDAAIVDYENFIKT